MLPNNGNKKSSFELKPWIFISMLGFVWGSSFFFTKIALEELPPITITATRIGLAALVLWIFVLLREYDLPRKHSMVGLIVLIGLLNTAIPYMLIAWGQIYVDSSVVSLLNSTIPIFALVIAQFLLEDEKITRKRLAGVSIGFIGVLVILSRGLTEMVNEGQASEALLTLTGHLAILIASSCYATSSVFIRKWLQHIDPIVLATLQCSVAFIATLICAIIIDRPISMEMSIKTIVSISYLGLFATALASILFFHILRFWGATRSSLVTYLIVFVGTFMGTLFLNEPFDAQLLLSLMLIVCAFTLTK